MAPNEAVQLVFSRSVEDDAFSTLLWADPAEAGREMGLTGADLYELVGAIEHANRGKELGRRRLIVIRDTVDQKHEGRWPFGDLSDDELIDRAAVAEEYARHLYERLGMAFDPPAHLEAVAQWAAALEAELARRAAASPAEVDAAIALALIDMRTLRAAVDRVKLT
jgi:hypothetical protein